VTAAAGGDEQRRVVELERINAELAAEIRNLTLDRTAQPRSALLGTTRRIVALTSERDATAAERDATAAELEQQNESLARVSVEIHALRRRVEVQSRELERLRAGPLGLVRRLKASLLRRRSATRGGDA
jgi:uncharacterized membrane protein YqiK